MIKSVNDEFVFLETPQKEVQVHRSALHSTFQEHNRTSPKIKTFFLPLVVDCSPSYIVLGSLKLLKKKKA